MSANDLRESGTAGSQTSIKSVTPLRNTYTRFSFNLPSFLELLQTRPGFSTFGDDWNSS